MAWAPIIRVLIETLGPLAVDLIAALVDGDSAAHARVRDIIPTPMRAQILLLHEQARRDATDAE